MCGIHDHNGSPIDHHHHGSDHAGSDQVGSDYTGSDHSGHRSERQIFRPRTRFQPAPRRALRSRRAFLGDFGKGTVALAVFTPLLAACSSDDSSSASEGDGSTVSDSDEPGTTEAQDSTEAGGGAEESAAEQTDETSNGTSDESTESLRWARANLGFVSAYVLARGNSAAIVDTGSAGSAEAIGETLKSLGLSYGDVEHLILTHKHGDHIGSIGEVMAEASSATVYAGEADLDSISAEDIVPLLGGEEIFGLRTVATPGHTLGHMAVLDETTGLLVAGDAVFTEGGGVVEGPEQFFSDIPQSRQSIRDLAALSFNTLLVGHGDPIEAGADTAVAELAASLP